ncbi:MAG: rRNA maturation RNase YbeY [Caulobacterales bacterium]|jgi:probable rRNA maturation factor
MIEVEIEDDRWTAAEPRCEVLALAAATAALAAAMRSGRQARAALAISLSSDAAVRDLNARFRGKDAATNVLSFPPPDAFAAESLGDVALAYGVCAREASEQGKPLADHLQHLVAHGVLHLLGYDHQRDAEAEAMEALERDILAGLGVPDPYAADQGAHG